MDELKVFKDVIGRRYEELDKNFSRYDYADHPKLDPNGLYIDVNGNYNTLLYFLLNYENNEAEILCMIEDYQIDVTNANYIEISIHERKYNITEYLIQKGGMKYYSRGSFPIDLITRINNQEDFTLERKSRITNLILEKIVS